MASAIPPLLSTIQAAFSAYNLYLSFTAIQKLRLYEVKSEKAAEWSNIAAHQLHKTRTTQASGSGAVLLSFFSSLSALLHHYATRSTFFSLVGLNIAAILAARAHVGEFWKGKAKVPLPGVGDYNDAISLTQEVRLNSAYLAVSWVVPGALRLILS